MTTKISTFTISLLFVSIQGIINSQETLTLSLEIQPRCIGKLVSSVAFAIVGSSDPPLEVLVCCTGTGPVISINSSHLDWGMCPVLTPVTKILSLKNESDVDAQFETFLVSNGFLSASLPYANLSPLALNKQLNLLYVHAENRFTKTAYFLPSPPQLPSHLTKLCP